MRVKTEIEELKKANKIYFDELIRMEKEITKYKNIVVYLEDIIVKLSDYIKDKKC